MDQHQDDPGLPELISRLDVVADGTWEIESTENFQPDGAFTLTVIQTDEAGNESVEINPFPSIIIATVALAPPTINTLPPQKAPFWLTGTGDPGAFVRILRGAAEEQITQIDANGNWRLWVVPAPDTSETVNWTAEQSVLSFANPDSVPSAPSGAVPVETDREVPPTPTIDFPLTNNPTGPITGTGNPGDTITLLADMVVDGSAAAQTVLGVTQVGPDDGTGVGPWTITPSALSEGDVMLVAVQSDSAGNSSDTPVNAGQSPSFGPVDTTAPVGLTIDTLQNTPIRTPVITGTGEPGATVEANGVPVVPVDTETVLPMVRGQS